MKHSIFGITMRMLFAKKQRLILTCIGIAVTFGLIIVISTLYSSMERSVQNIINKEIGTFDLSVGYSPFKGENGKKLLTADQISQIASMEGVIESGVAIHLLDIAIERTVRQGDGINYTAVESNDLIRNYFQFTTTIQPDEMVITEEVARRWGVAVGDRKEFTMNNGIVLRKIVSEIIPNYQSGPAVIMNINAIREEYSLGEVANTVYLDLAEGVSDKAIAAAIRAEIDANMDIALRSEDDTFLKETTMFKFLAIGLGGVLLLVSILFLTSSFKLMLLGRVRELSTFRMIGATKKVIFKMVMMEAAVLNLLGVVFGIVAGIVMSRISAWFIDSIMGITLHTVEIDWKIISIIALLGWLVLTMSVIKIAFATATSAAPLTAVRQSEQQELGKVNAWLAGGLFIVGCALLCLAWLDFFSNSRLLLTLLGSLLAAVGCILGTGYLIPIISFSSGWFIRRFAIAEAYYAMKQFVALRKQNSFIVMLLASIVTACIAIPAFIDNLNRANAEQVMRDHITPIIIEKRVDVMSSSIVEQVRQVAGVEQALPMGSPHAVLLGDMDYDRADPKWLKRNSNPPEFYEKGAPLYDTYQYQWAGVAQTDLKLMQQMGLIALNNQDLLLSGIIIQPEYAKHMGIGLGESVSLQKTSLGEKLEQYDLPISGVVDLNFTIDETLMLVDYRNAEAAWTDGLSNKVRNGLSPRTIYVQVSEDADISSVRAELATLLENDPLIKVTDLDSELLRIEEQSKEQYAILWTVMVIFVIVAIVGVTNTLGATFHAHRREYAILRAIRLTIARLRSVMIVQGLLYAVTAIVVGVIAGAWIIVGLISGSTELSGWTINWFAIAIPIVVLCVISLLVSFLYAKQIAMKSITEELTVE